VRCDKTDACRVPGRATASRTARQHVSAPKDVRQLQVRSGTASDPAPALAEAERHLLGIASTAAYHCVNLSWERGRFGAIDGVPIADRSRMTVLVPHQLFHFGSAVSALNN
jgi:hypothetical protein